MQEHFIKKESQKLCHICLFMRFLFVPIVTFLLGIVFGLGFAFYKLQM